MEKLKEFGDGWSGVLIETKEVIQTLIIGESFIPPIGVEAAFDNWSSPEQYDAEFFDQFPELKTDGRRLVTDKVIKIDVETLINEKDSKEMHQAIVEIERCVYAMHFKTYASKNSSEDNETI